VTLPVRRARYGARQWDPFGRLGFDNIFDQMSRMLSTAFPDVARITVHSWVPPVDVQETENDYVIEADLPGVKAEDINVDLHGRELRITGEYGGAEQPGGEQAEGKQPGGEQQQTSARRSGRFDYRVTLPSEVNAESCNADLEQGTLRLRLPKVTTSAGRRIPVQGGGGQALQAGSQQQTRGTGG
jgi:HSP20 family protein